MKNFISSLILGIWFFKSIYSHYINDKLFEIAISEDDLSEWYVGSKLLFPIGFIFWRWDLWTVNQVHKALKDKKEKDKYK